PSQPGPAPRGSSWEVLDEDLLSRQAQPGARVRVVLLRVAGVGVAAVTAGGLGVAAGGLVVALVHRRLVFLLGLRAVALGAAALAAVPGGGVTRAGARVVLLDLGVVGGVRVASV